MPPNRDDAFALMTEYTRSESPRKHMLAVEAAVRGYARMFGETEDGWGGLARRHAFEYEREPDQAAVRGYARMFGENEDDWGVVALLHDFDYERYPDQENHPFRGVEVLKAKGYPEWVTRAILSHAEYWGVSRESRLEHTLYACDEM